jgi:uncharacterized membrane protein YfcA
VELLVLLGAGIVAGAMNAAVGSGTLVTYPLLLAYGLPPVIANGTNTMGIAPGNVAGAWSYRRQLTGRRRTVIRLAAVIGLGAALGATLVLVLPSTVFEAVVPWLILVACALVLAQPRISRLLRERGVDATRLPRRALVPVLLVIGIYAGYFGAAQGIVLIAALTTLLDADLQRSNAVKNVLQGVSNGVAGVVFALGGAVAWGPAIAVGTGAVIGGFVGAPVARRLPDAALRGLIVAIGLAAAVVSFRAF